MTYQRNIRERSFRRGAFLEDGLDDRLPDRVEQSEVAARERDEAEHDRRALADLAAVGPLDPAQLVDAVAQEGDEPAVLAAGPVQVRRAGRAGGAGSATRGDQVTLDLV